MSSAHIGGGRISLAAVYGFDCSESQCGMPLSPAGKQRALPVAGALPLLRAAVDRLYAPAQLGNVLWKRAMSAGFGPDNHRDPEEIFLVPRFERRHMDTLPQSGDWRWRQGLALAASP